MGAGKSSVGKQLAKLTGKTWYDSDAEIKNRTGVPLAWIFETEQEAGFRLREHMIIEELSRLNNIILSTGGGSIVSHENRTILKDRGFVAYLKVSLDEQLHRTSVHKETRPLIDLPDPKPKLIELNTERTPLYESIADMVCDTDKLTPKKVAEKIYAAYQLT